jgi:nitric oxide dioxygenase
LAAGAPDGLVSNFLHDAVGEGDVVQLGPPCGEFFLDFEQPPARPIVLVSGGIGLTPLVSMLKSLVHHGVTTPVYFIHGARNSQVHALAAEVRGLAAGRGNIRTHFRYDAPLPDDLRERRCDSAGLIDIDLLRQLLPTNDADYYFCGPKPFMVGLYHGLKTWGVSEERLHFEFFGPRQELAVSPPLPQPPHARPWRADQPAETSA